MDWRENYLDVKMRIIWDVEAKWKVVMKGIYLYGMNVREIDGLEKPCESRKREQLQ